MKVTAAAIPDIRILEPQVFADQRGFIMQTYQDRELEKAGIHATFVQENHCESTRGVLRGLHYQIKQPQGKLLRVLAGEIYDVVVDLRKSSPTFGQWLGFHLTGTEHRHLWIRPGFAHGFYVLSDRAVVLYKLTDYYAPEWERTLLWNDSDLRIAWPLVNGQPPILSAKDAAGKSWKEAEYYV
jgi:dTDP-4-dehydrorhamnose 3,5-epimerase